MHAGSAADAVRAGSECRRPAPQLIAAAAPATMPDEMLASIIHACIYAPTHATTRHHTCVLGDPCRNVARDELQGAFHKLSSKDDDQNILEQELAGQARATASALAAAEADLEEVAQALEGIRGSWALAQQVRHLWQVQGATIRCVCMREGIYS